MNKLATALLSLALLAATWPLAMGAQAEPTAQPMAFGTAANAVIYQKDAGVPADLGTFWVGPWTLKSGWGGPDYEMKRMRANDVTPAIHFYYWGDDMSKDCLANGCWSDLHSAQKDQAGWDKLADQLIQHLNSEMGGEKVYILLETEFNKGEVQYHEPLDEMLAVKAQKIKDGYPAAEVVLAMGNWNRGAWTTWDRAAAASDHVGIQGMRGSTRDSPAHYDDLYESTLAGAQDAKKLFGKSVMIQDLALSSYPEPEYLHKQEAELKQFFDNMGPLKQAGVFALMYRAWTDNPNMDLKNYYGEAERHWGLHQEHWGAAKPAGHVWIDGVKAERASPAAPVAAPAGAFSAQFDPSPNNHEWWVDVKVTSASTIAKVEASHDGKPFVQLSKTHWGSWAKSFNAPAGGEMVFRATDADGQTTSKAFAWLQPAETTLPAFSATFEPSKNNNEWWVDTKVTSSSTIAKVEASHDGKPFVQLDQTNWGSYAKSFSAPAGGEMVFRATDSHGQTVSKGFPWLPVTNTAPVAKFTATSDGLKVSVDASGSSDADGDALSYVFEFGDGAKATGATASHTYATPGDHTVKLTVSDGKLSSTASHTVTAIQPNRAPVAAFTATADGLKVSVDASGSSDADGDALSYAFDFGDGSKATGQTADHAYAAAGDYTVTLTVSDGKLSSTASQTVTAIQPNRAPVAAFTATADGLKISVDASGSSDADGDALSYAFDFGDGAKSSSKSATHTYAAPGDYKVTLTVSDGKLGSTASQTVTAIQPNRAPVAAFTATVDGLKGSVDASGSSDADGDALSYTFSFGDGATWVGKTASHTYAAAGDYTVKLTVSDGKASATTSKTVTVKPVAFTADVQPSPNVNNWWVEARASGNAPIVKVEAKAGDGAWTTLPATSWGTYAKSFYVATGTPVSFRATAADGQTVTTEPQPWIKEVSTFKATFTPKTQGNPWWIETNAAANEPIAQVQVRIDGGTYKTMEKTQWDSYAIKEHTKKGSTVQFRAIAESGAKSASDPIVWR